MDNDKMKPILFNTEMVRAILDGRKTVSRRVAKCKRNGIDETIIDVLSPIDPIGNVTVLVDSDYLGGYRLIKSLYQKGDILYVRETWKIVEYLEELSMRFEYEADGKVSDIIDFTSSRVEKFLKFVHKKGWLPSLFMPKEAARIFLKVTDVRVERLRDITEEQAIMEGTQFFTPSYRFELFKSKWLNGMCMDCKHSNPFSLTGCGSLGRNIELLENCGCTFGFSLRDDDENLEPARLRFFAYLQHMANKSENWDFTHKANPFVWVYEFERVNFDG